MNKLLLAGAAFAALASTFGCSTPRSASIKAIDAAAFCEKNAGLDYAACRPRDTEAELKAALIADITLLEVEEPTARRMLDLRGANDIAPRAFKEPLGETLSAFVDMNGCGEVLLRPSIAITPATPTPIEYNRDFAWLADYKITGEGDKAGWMPIVKSVWVGVRATLEANSQADGSWQLTLNSESAQVVRPVPTFLSGTGPTSLLKIQVPELVSPKRTASQDVKPGETAAFVLGGVQGENPTVRLLFVRLEKP